MEYYVIYDLNDNFVAYCDNIKELSKITGIRIKHINYNFKNRCKKVFYNLKDFNCFIMYIDNSDCFGVPHYKKIYKFID